MRKKLIGVLTLLISTGFLYGCSEIKSTENNEEPYQKVEEILGTVISGIAYGENGKEALEEAFARAKEIEQIMSVKIDDSEISYVNSKAAKEKIAISEELFYVIAESIKFAQISEGALDITIGNLIDLWGIGTEKERIPSMEELANHRGKNNYQNIILSEDDRTIYFLNEDIKLDLGAIAKGYVADEMKEVIIESGVSSALLNLGGNVMTIGSKLDGSKWTVGITNPLNISEIQAMVKVNGETVVTSGNYERYFEADGIRYHHILNPLTAEPAESGLISTTIIAEESIVADALSTATYILGIDKSIELIESIEGVEGVLISNSGEVFTTSGMARKEFTVVENEG